MKKFAEQLKKQSESIRMSVDEKAQLRERLLSFMEYHPMPGGQAVDLKSLVKESKKPLLSLDAWLWGRLVGGFAVMILVVVPALAENALPGETLYPVKVRFNEEVRGAMSSSPYAKIEWETERMERRLAEAQVLSEAGRLTPEAEAEVAGAILEHSAAAKSNIETLRVSDNDEAVMAEIALSSALEVSAEVLTKRDQGESESSTSLLSGAVSEARASLNINDDSLSYDKLFSRVETETTRAHEYLDTLNSSITESERNDIDRRLTDIKIKLEAAAIVRQTDESAAARQVAEALGSTRKLISFMTNLEVRRNVTVEELVPIILTEAEEKETIETKIADAAKLVAVAETQVGTMATSSNDYVAVTETFAQYHVLESEAIEALEAGNLKDAGITRGFLLELAEALRDTMKGLGFETNTNIEGEAGVDQ